MQKKVLGSGASGLNMVWVVSWSSSFIVLGSTDTTVLASPGLVAATASISRL